MSEAEWNNIAKDMLPEFSAAEDVETAKLVIRKLKNKWIRAGMPSKELKENSDGLEAMLSHIEKRNKLDSTTRVQQFQLKELERLRADQARRKADFDIKITTLRAKRNEQRAKLEATNKDSIRLVESSRVILVQCAHHRLRHHIREMKKRRDLLLERIAFAERQNEVRGADITKRRHQWAAHISTYEHKVENAPWRVDEDRKKREADELDAEIAQLESEIKHLDALETSSKAAAASEEAFPLRNFCVQFAELRVKTCTLNKKLEIEKEAVHKLKEDLARRNPSQGESQLDCTQAVLAMDASETVDQMNHGAVLKSPVSDGRDHSSDSSASGEPSDGSHAESVPEQAATVISQPYVSSQASILSQLAPLEEVAEEREENNNETIQEEQEEEEMETTVDDATGDGRAGMPASLRADEEEEDIADENAGEEDQSMMEESLMEADQQEDVTMDEREPMETQEYEAPATDTQAEGLDNGFGMVFSNAQAINTEPKSPVNKGAAPIQQEESGAFDFFGIGGGTDNAPANGDLNTSFDPQVLLNMSHQSQGGDFFNLMSSETGKKAGAADSGGNDGGTDFMSMFGGGGDDNASANGDAFSFNFGGADAPSADAGDGGFNFNFGF